MKIGHVHIPKTAGTSVNSWLDDLVSFRKARPATFQRSFGEYMAVQHVTGPLAVSLCAQVSWQAYDVVHGHDEIVAEAPKNTFLFTFLREPKARAVSQYRDHKRLEEHDFAHLDDRWKDYHRACISDDMRNVLIRFRDFPGVQALYEDMQCRSLLAWKYAPHEFYRLPPEKRFQEAAQVLENKIQFIGLQETFDASMLALSKRLRAYPASSGRKLNVAKGQSDESPELLHLLRDMNQADTMLYAFGSELADRFSNLGTGYKASDFEHDGLEFRLDELRNELGADIYTMNHALIGFGFSGRDAAGTENCCRWVAEPRSVIYLPRRSSQVAIYVRGWVHPEVRETFKIRANDQDVEFRFEKRDGAEDVVVFAPPEDRPYVKIEMSCSRTFTDTEAGRPSEDPRQKGAAIWRVEV